MRETVIESIRSLQKDPNPKTVGIFFPKDGVQPCLIWVLHGIDRDIDITLESIFLPEVPVLAELCSYLVQPELTWPFSF